MRRVWELLQSNAWRAEEHIGDAEMRCPSCRPLIKDKLARVVKTSDQARQEAKER